MPRWITTAEMWWDRFLHRAPKITQAFAVTLLDAAGQEIPGTRIEHVGAGTWTQDDIQAARYMVLLDAAGAVLSHADLHNPAQAYQVEDTLHVHLDARRGEG